MAQVAEGVPRVPNFWPAMKITLGASGSAATAARIEQIGPDDLDSRAPKGLLSARIPEA